MKHVELARKSKSSSHWTRLAAASLLAVAALAGCGGGDDGAAGAPGTPGTNGTNGTNGQDLTAVINTLTMSATDWQYLAPVATVNKVEINSPPKVTLTVVDSHGTPVTGLKNASFAFTIAKLVPSTAGSPNKWVSYIVGDPATGAPSTPSTENTGVLTETSNGVYTYTFSRDITGPLQASIATWFGTDLYKETQSTRNGVTSTLRWTQDDVLGPLVDGKRTLLDYDKNLTHRVVVVIRGLNGTNLDKPVNAIYDFVPATGLAVTASDEQREIVATAKCNECHDKIGVTTPHGGRVDTRYCVTCHTDQRKNGKFEATTVTGGYSGTTYKINGNAVGNFPVFVHQIHMGNKLTKTGYNYADVKFNDIVYPQEITNCTKCHDGSATSTAKTAQGDNWKTKPSALACSSCHDGIDFKTGAGHVGGAAADDSTCALCHKVGYVDTTLVHAGINKSPNNPVVPTGLVNFTYNISSATVDATTNDLTIKFKILADESPVTLATPASTVPAVLSGFTGSPSFLLAYGNKDGTGVDFDNFGLAAAQPASISIATLLDTDNSAVGSIAGPDSGVYTATIKSTSAFPVGSKLRTVALQGYFTQAAGTGSIAAATARHTLSVVKTVTGDTVRRVVVEAAKCANCHEVFEGHGGNRNIGKLTGTTEVVICAMCHNPNLSSSGKTLDTINPEATNNLKDMVHAIHAGAFRKANDGDAFAFVRNFSGSARPFDFSGVKFPGILNNCESCHKAGTYASVPTGALMTTNATTDGTNATSDAVKAARESVPNATDKVIPPFTASCYSCHNSPDAIFHISVDKGTPLDATRSSNPGEGCALCHGAGRTNDPVLYHKK
ncbi:OmcA/MtrC family decaheme c-type cytochrome [Rhodoferax sp.]|uniref:OmcA/MtrC family decaheme c-type cytochrome n=1 Tax=Rhodoferax sp. TaxID=50421 RepID=UPI00262EB075|nr:OmcA/MtrC family decaheme c-type cytochrome [Rhodoferax sp.]MDD3937013.1 OmcA/MtrC family decaheme c-type cytochrome [Rhodoferax sp.]